MANGTRWEAFEALRPSPGFARLASVLAMAFVICLLPIRGASDDGRFCSETATAAFDACGHDVLDAYSTAVAVCINVSDDEEREECLADARASRSEGNQLCRRQLTERRRVCRALGEDRYDPDFDPDDFDTEFTNANRYFPLRIGNRWEYRGGTETITVEVLNQTKLIEGVTCIVHRDRVTDDGDLIEDTDDWFAQAHDGNVWYCGEEVKNYESFPGDHPRRPELVNVDGSFKAGRDGDKPGIIFRASPQRGELYREEFSLGNAEDLAQVMSTTYSFGSDANLDQLVPPALARLLCSNDCVVTKNFSPLEPGVVERKYYARGIGFFLEVNPTTGEVLQLVSCNVDPRCSALPSP